MCTSMQHLNNSCGMKICESDDFSWKDKIATLEYEHFFGETWIVMVNSWLGAF